MKYLAIKCGAFLLLGAIMNIAVAWGVSRYRFAEYSSTELHDHSGARLWDDHARAHLGPIYGLVPCTRSCYFGLTTEAVVLKVNTVPRERRVVIAIAAGLPCRSLDGVDVAREPFGSPAQVWYERSIESPLEDDRNPQHLAGWLPVGIRGSGFAIDTVFYAAILWMMIAAPLAIRRRSHIKHGLCPACAYPTGGSEVCTECGAQVHLPLSVGEGRGEGEVREP